MAEAEKIYSSTFWRMCAGALLFFLSFNIILPELPDALRAMGGNDYIGWILPSFALSALLARPFSGWVTDRLGRRMAMIGGALFCVAAGLLYPIAGSIFVFFLIRLLHGFSTGFSPTGFTAFTTDIVPEQRRGEALGWQGIFSNLGTSLGYGLGAYAVLYLGRSGLYLASSLLAAAAIIFFYSLPETKPAHIPHQRGKGIIYLPAWPPALGMLLVCVPLGAILTVMPDFTLAHGIVNKGLFLTVYISSSLLVRLFSGRLSDRMGREITVTIGSSLQALAMILLTADAAFWMSAVLYGVGQGFNAPGLFAWTGDLSKPETRGRALAMLFMALEAGVIIGGLFSGYTISYTDNYSLVFAVCAMSCSASALFAAGSWYKRKRTR